MHKILILGPQGSGKGTQAQLLAGKLGVPAVSMGQLIRDVDGQEGPYAEEARKAIETGALVSDEVALELLKARLAKGDAQGGYIIDGYPRNLNQYAVYNEFDTPTAVLLIDVPREESMVRLVKRAELEGREDDTPDVIGNRLKIYEEETMPVVGEYQKQGVMKEVSGLGSREEVEARVAEAVGI